MAKVGRLVTAAIASVALTASSVASAATAPASPASTPAAQNPWVTLAMLTPVSAATVNGSAAAVQAAPPLPPGPPLANQYPPGTYQYTGYTIPPPPLPLLVFWAAMLAAFIAVVSQKDERPTPNSPV